MRLVPILRRLTAPLALLTLLGAGGGPQGLAGAPSPGLEDLYRPGWMLLDDNGDGFVDGVAAGVRAIGGEPRALAAAADLAARLGFETMGLDLPGPADPAVEIVVGEGLGADREGRVPRPGRSRILLESRGVDRWRIRVLADDAAGLDAGVTQLAGRLPMLWAADGLSLEEAVAAVETGLETVGVESDLRAVAIGVDAERPGLAELVLELSPDVPAGTRERLQPLAGTSPGWVPEGIHRLRLRVPGNRAATIDLVGPGLADAPAEVGGRPGASGTDELSLSRLYTIGGLLGDADGDLVPDRTDVLLSPGPGSGPEVAEVGARIGLESAGVTLPVAREPDSIGDPESAPTLVLFGEAHPLVQGLLTEGAVAQAPATPASGAVEVAPGAFGDRDALLVRGAGAGLAAATGWLARTAPYLRHRGPDRPTVGTVEEDLRRFASLRSPEGQAAAALYALDRFLAKLPSDAGEVRVQLAVEEADDALGELAEARMRDAGVAGAVDIVGLHVREARELLDETILLPAETAGVRRLVDAELLPRIRGGEAVDVRVHVSEPGPVREALEAELEQSLEAAGAERADVEVLPAYKQGFGWIEEVIIPDLAPLRPATVEIRYARYRPPASWPGQAMGTPSRWLLELFPVDEVIARELDVSLDAVDFVEAPSGQEATYRVIARDADGGELYAADFSPRLVERPYFAFYPRYETVRITSGGIEATAGGRSLLDRRLITDVERVWNHFQDEILPFLHDAVLEVAEGRPRTWAPPYFGELRIEVEASEPERALGIDQERISPLESLHEELYFGTLHFFDLFGRISAGSPLSYPGRVIPVVRPRRDGLGGEARFRITGFEAPAPRVRIDYVSRGRDRVLERELRPVELERPRAVAAGVVADRPGLASLTLRVRVDSQDDRREELLTRAPGRRVDATWISGDQIRGMLAALAELREHGAYRGALAYPGLERLRVQLGTGHEPDLLAEPVTVLAPNGEPEPLPEPRRLLTGASELPPEGLVQWRRPIPPDEAYEILAVLDAEFDAAYAYRVGESYMGREMWSLDLTAPIPRSHTSRAKATELKPTIVYSARQHANEVSSTSHVLRLAERLLTDPAYEGVLDRLNVVVHPITNPDGAQLAYELYRITPDHMLHAGYLGSLGVDVTAGAGEEDPVYPEANVRERLWSAWRPDIFLNPHGYPSHEWVQLFSEYAGWVRHRTTEARDWWGMRGWFMPGFAYLDDPEYPRHDDFAFRIRDAITDAINALPDIVALNERAYDRYRRYGVEGDPERFRMDMADDVLIYTSLEGERAGGSGWVARNPKVTIWAGSTEAPDETAHGDWLELVASAGLAWDLAILELMLEAEHPVETLREPWEKGIRLAVHRERPGRLPDEDAPER